MNRTLGVERTYYLGEYKNIKLHDIFNEVPDELVTNPEFIGNIRLMQFARLEKDYREYLHVLKQINQLGFEDAMAILNDMETNAVDEIIKLIKNGNYDATTKEKLEEYIKGDIKNE